MTGRSKNSIQETGHALKTTRFVCMEELDLPISFFLRRHVASRMKDTRIGNRYGMLHGSFIMYTYFYLIFDIGRELENILAEFRVSIFNEEWDEREKVGFIG